MIALVWILTLAAATRIDLVDEVYSIPADQWRYIEVTLQQPALVLAHYQVTEPSAPVRIAFMRHGDMEHLRDGLPHGVIETSGPGRTGTLRAQAPPGNYVVVVDNEAASGHRADVHLRVWLDFSKRPAVSELSPQRQITVVLISLAAFLAIAAWSLHKLRKAMGPP